jgi:galactokinase
MVSCAFSHGVYLIVSKNNQSQYRFWSFSHPAIKCFEKRQFNRNKEQSWIKFSLNIFGQFSNHGIDINCGFDMFLWGNLYDNKNAGHQIESLTSHVLNQQLGVNLNLNTSNNYPKINSEHLIVISNTHIPHKISNSPLINQQTKNKSKWEQYLASEKLLIEESLAAIKSENIIEIGRLINENHILLCDVLEIVPPEIDIMVTEASKIDGVLGSRMTGCGFGGSTISLIKEEAIHTFVEQMSEIYEFETDVKNSFYIANIGDEVFKLYELV